MIAGRPRRRLGRLGLTAWLCVVQIALGVVGIGWWIIDQGLQPQKPAPNVVPAEVIALPASLEGALPAAAERAIDWNNAARLLSASAQIDWPLDQVPPGIPRQLPPGGWLNYVFVAAWDHPFDAWEAASLAIRVERSAGSVQVMEPITWSDHPNRQALLPASPAVGSVNAVLIAEATAGADFRRGCAWYRHTTRVSFLPESEAGGEWIVSYTDDRTGDGGEPNDLKMTVDAETGEVADVVDRSRPCDEDIR